VNAVMNLRVPKKLGSSWVAAQLAASQEGLSSMSEWYLLLNITWFYVDTIRWLYELHITWTYSYMATYWILKLAWFNAVIPSYNI
jgi:hypothetical protein